MLHLVAQTSCELFNYEAVRSAPLPNTTSNRDRVRCVGLHRALDGKRSESSLPNVALGRSDRTGWIPIRTEYYVAIALGG
jgi:hypothetical protein